MSLLDSPPPSPEALSVSPPHSHGGASHQTPLHFHSEKPIPSATPAVEVSGVDLFYGKHQALHNIHLTMKPYEVTAFIGPSGCGKSTLLRCINRMNDLVDNCKVHGSIKIHGHEINSRKTDVITLRKRVGMVFQKPNPFPKSIYENIVYPLRIDGLRGKSLYDETVERSLRSAGLWDEVKDRLHASALALSGGQQQRLCIARAVASQPDILLMDEPCSALDPIATHRIEELMGSLRKQVTIVIVTHNMHQAMRVADTTAFFYLGKLIEAGVTDKIFSTPKHQQTLDYVTGRFG